MGSLKSNIVASRPEILGRNIDFTTCIDSFLWDVIIYPCLNLDSGLAKPMMEIGLALDSIENNPDSKVHGANMGPTWVLPAPGGPHVGPINFAICGPFY